MHGRLCAMEEHAPEVSHTESPEIDPPFGELSSDHKTMGMLCHLLAFAGYFIPFGNIFGPMILWFIK
jgi:uncharacterized Tic20 family protein